MKNIARLFARLPLPLSCVIVCLAAAGAAVKIPFSYPEGDFANNVHDYLTTGHVTSTFLPDTYPFLMGTVARWSGVPGALAAQSFIYLLLAFCSFLLIRFFLREDRIAAIGALLVSLNPDLLSSIAKLWDTLPTCLGLISLTALCLRLYRRPSPGVLVTLALVWGVSTSVRPNFALLFAPVVLVLWLNRARHWMANVALFTLISFAAYAGCNTLSHGSFYVPSNGPYNLFAGANPYAQQAFVQGYNGETGIDTALHALGVHFSDHRELWLTPTYKTQALLFIRTHPGEYAWLMVVKLLNLLRPDLKAHSVASAIGIFKVLTSLCMPLWVAALVLGRRTLTRADAIVISIAVSYIVPFLLTNSDPRFRVPLDTLALSHTTALVLRQRKAARSSAAEDRVSAQAA